MADRVESADDESKPPSDELATDPAADGSGSRLAGMPLRDDAQSERDFLMRELERLGVIGQSSWGVAGALIGFLVAAAVAYFVQNDTTSTGVVGFVDRLFGVSGGDHASDTVLILMSVVLVAGGGYLMILFTQQVLQSYYTRQIEVRLAQLAKPLTLEQQRCFYEDPDMFVVAGIAESLTAAYNSNRRGVRPARWLFKLTMLMIIVAIIGISVSMARQISNVPLRVLMLTLMSVVFFLGLRLGWQSGVRGQKLWLEVKRRALVELGLADASADQWRPTWDLPKYLLLPRPTETVMKGVALHLVPALVGLAYAWGYTSVRESLKYAAISFVCFELLLYQGRYMVNDLRELNDRKHPSPSRKKRLPRLDTDRTGAPKWSRHVVFWLVFGVRAAAPFVIVWLAARDLAVEFSIAFGIAIVAAVVYELLREGDVAQNDLRPRDILLFITVGISYGVRGGLGFMVGSDRLAPFVLVLALGGALYLTGLCSVLVTWTQESAQFAANSAELREFESKMEAVGGAFQAIPADLDRNVLLKLETARQERERAKQEPNEQAAGEKQRTGEPTSQPPAEPPMVNVTLPLPVHSHSFGTKTHLLPLGCKAKIVQLPPTPVEQAEAVSPTGDDSPTAEPPEAKSTALEVLARMPFLKDRTLKWWQQPFGIVVPPGICVGLVAGYLARRGPDTPIPWTWALILAVVGLGVGPVAAWRPVPFASLGGVAVLAFGMGGAVGWIDGQFWLGALAPTVVIANYTIARGLSYHDTQHPFEPLATGLEALPKTAKAFAGALVE